MQAVIDTNVLVSAILRPHGPSGRLVRALSARRFRAYYSRGMLDELTAVLAETDLRERYDLSDVRIAIVVSALKRRGRRVSPSRKVMVCRDPNDNMILEAALAARADAIVSADNDLLALGSFEGVPIVAPARFMEILAEEEART